jgi:23S rRNA (adenine2030-N6)-methyltransferase
VTRYRDTATPDYSHRYHAGNVGDVWKHCALVEILRRTAAASRSVAYVESHAGEGRYALGPTGEWTEGIGRLWAAREPATDDAVARYVALCRRLGHGAARPETYPGSPALARAVLGPDADLGLWERDTVACARLEAELRGDSRASVHHGDGLAALAPALRAAEERAVGVAALVDPPWTAKTDWSAVPEAVIAAAHAAKRACIVLWYPLKSLTRPNAMLARFDRAGVGATAIELVTTPLGERRSRLNGSGILLVRAPEGVLPALAAALPVIGAQCATRERWSARIVADARPTTR